MSPISSKWTLSQSPKLNKTPFTRWFASWSIFYLFRVQLRTFLRGVGLKLLTFLGPKAEEPSKVLINKSRKLALARSAIHLLPAGVSLGLIALNFRAYFIGAELQGARDQDDLKFGLLQVAAKIQELLVVSSLGVIIFHALRSELVFGQGLPLGLIVSGWSFTQLSYFWSPEFWAGFLIRDKTLIGCCRRLGFLLLVFVAGLMAVLAGPTAAILMIPRELQMPLGGGIFWLNGSDEQLWPTYLDSRYYDAWNCTYQEKYLVSSKCPSAGFLSLYMHYSTWWNYPLAGYQFELQDTNARKLVYAWPSPDQIMDTWAYTTHTASATLQDAFVTIHSRALSWLDHNKPREYPYPRNVKFAKTKRYEVKTKFPAVRTACLSHNMTNLRNESLTVRFPILPEFGRAGKPPPLGHEIEVYQLIRDNMANRGIVYNDEMSLDEMVLNGTRRIFSMPVPIPNHTVSSLGLILLINRTDAELDRDAQNFNLATCSIDARWVRGTSIIEAATQLPLDHEFFNGKARNLMSTEYKLKGRAAVYPSPGDTTEDGPPIGIHLTPSWYDIFSPAITSNVFQIPGLLGAVENQTTLERILEASLSFQRDFLSAVECTIATAVADGLSRCGIIPNDKSSRFLGAWPDGNFDIQNESIARTMVRFGDPKETFSMPSILADGNSTRLEMKAKFTGYAIYANGRFDYFSIIVLLCHALLALAHTIWVLSWGETGESWDSIAEMIALAHKSPSPPEDVLNNTCAGISTLKSLASVAWVESSDNKENLRLRFKETQEPRGKNSRPKVDLSYNN